MKKIINNRLYNTDTAKEIGEYTNGQVGGLDYMEETLYKKHNGEYFLYGFGGAQTRYAHQVELNGWGSGEEIMPFTFDQAREWAESRLSVDDYAKAFGMPSEGDDDEKSYTPINLESSTYEKLNGYALSHDMTVDEAIAHLVNAVNEA